MILAFFGWKKCTDFNVDVGLGCIFFLIGFQANNNKMSSISSSAEKCLVDSCRERKQELKIKPKERTKKRAALASFSHLPPPSFLWRLTERDGGCSLTSLDVTQPRSLLHLLDCASVPYIAEGEGNTRESFSF